jgi:hypothetical protein
MTLPPLTPALSPRCTEREHQVVRGDAEFIPALSMRCEEWRRSRAVVPSRRDAAPGHQTHRNAADFCQLTPDSCP